MQKQALAYYTQQLEDIRKAGTWREERVITTPQESRINTTQSQGVINLCANNYLGLSNDARVIAAARSSYDSWGFGLSSVRFICGTQLIHKQLEQRLAAFLQMDEVVLYSSCYDANGGLFETILGEQDAVISDALNHASIIDGIRLCKARRLRYDNSDMAQLEQHLKDSQDARIRLIVTDGVFSMDGYLAKLQAICDLAERYEALVMVDDSHATGFMGQTGRGTHEACGVMGRVDIITSTFGKAMGGASGGFTAARKPIAQLLRQRSRPYLFSNSLAPAICAATLKALDILEADTHLRDRVHENAAYFRSQMSSLGFELLPGEHPIVPVMLHDAHVAAEMARRMLDHGVYVIAFSYPVVPQGQARIRTQISAAHTHEDINRAVAAFRAVKAEMNL